MRQGQQGLKDEGGQTTVEFMMIAGLITAIAISVLGYVQPRFRCQFARMVSCMIDDYDDCMSNPVIALPICPEDLTVHVPKF